VCSPLRAISSSLPNRIKLEHGRSTKIVRTVQDKGH
jgi:hypothetical protein